MKRYIDEFIKLRCAPDMLALNLFPNGKEITESMAAYNAVREHIVKQCDAGLGGNTIALVAVGDGHRPRTAALFAFRSAWTCFSIDPALRDKQYPVERLTLLRRRVEDEVLDLTGFSQVIVVLVHSHATIENVLRGIKAKVMHIVSIPCCTPHEMEGCACIEYQDEAIWSPKNTVKVWLNAGVTA